jgi:EAL domain-containing protein (putative c-di-GMP-specific phosphodiesterase class I)
MDPLTLLKELDASGDGKVSEDDFVKIAEQIGLGFIGKFLIKQAFRRFLDKNKDGTLDHDEALAAFDHLKQLVYASKGNAT